MVEKKDAVSVTGRRVSRRRFVEAAGAGAGAMLLMAKSPLRAQETGEPLKIGVMGPFTGPASRTGDGFKKGVTMALEDARAAGEVPVTIDGKKRDIELVWVDSQSSPVKAVTAVTEAITRQGVEFMLTGWHSSVAMAVMDTEAPFHIVHIGHQGESQYVSEKINKDPEKYRGWFKGWPAPPIFAGLYGDPLKYFMEKGLWQPANRKAAVLVEDTDFGRGWGEALMASLKDAGFEPMDYDVTALDETEFAPLLLKYRAANVSIVAMTSTGSVSTSNFVKQFQDQRFKALLLGHGITWFSEWPQLTGDASNYVITMDSPRVIAPWQKEWVERYKAKYNEEPSIAPAGHPYDYFRMSVQILNDAGTLDFDTLVKRTREIKYKGVWHLYDFAEKAGPNAMAPGEVKTGPFMEGFFFPMVQLMNGEAKIIWPLEFAEAEFQAPSLG